MLPRPVQKGAAQLHAPVGFVPSQPDVHTTGHWRELSQGCAAACLDMMGLTALPELLVIAMKHPDTIWDDVFPSDLLQLQVPRSARGKALRKQLQ